LAHASSRVLIGRLVRGYLKPHTGRLAVAVVCMMAVALCTALFAHLIEPLFDDVFAARNARMLVLIPAFIIGIYLVKGVAEYTQNFLMEFIGQRVVADLQRDLYRHVVYQDLAFFHRHTTPSLTARFLFDLHRLRQAFSQAITGSMRDVTMIIGLTINLVDKDWVLALLALTVFPLVVYPVTRLGRRTRRYAAGTQERTGSLNLLLQETFAYNRQVKAYTMEEREIQRSEQSINDVFGLMMKAAKVRAVSSPMMELLGGVSCAGVILYGGSQVIAGNLTQGAFMSFLTSVLLMYRPIKGLTNLNNTVQEGLAAAQRTFELLDEPRTVNDAPGALALDRVRGDVRFDNVTFRYADGSLALQGLTLDIPAGKTVAVVGPSGAGKSTLINLIPRFYDPEGGQVCVDGHDVKTLRLDSLRSQIALVSQEVALFHDTVANNIAYGRPGASRDDIIAAARDAAAHDFILQLPNGYDTLVGEQGVNLSGGQRQRLSIARALLKNAPILLLDEATSNLDTQSERQVQDALNRLMKGRTTLVVAHRLSTIVGADRIHVLNEGRIAESGTHDSLLKARGMYARLYQLQDAV
jgi:subfamily B ATP-binding cassette protein MsbA